MGYLDFKSGFEKATYVPLYSADGRRLEREIDRGVNAALCYGGRISQDYKWAVGMDKDLGPLSRVRHTMTASELDDKSVQMVRLQTSFDDPGERVRVRFLVDVIKDCKTNKPGILASRIDGFESPEDYLIGRHRSVYAARSTLDGFYVQCFKTTNDGETKAKGISPATMASNLKRILKDYERLVKRYDPFTVVWEYVYYR